MSVTDGLPFTSTVDRIVAQQSQQATQDNYDPNAGKVAADAGQMADQYGPPAPAAPSAPWGFASPQQAQDYFARTQAPPYYLAAPDAQRFDRGNGFQDQQYPQTPTPTIPLDQNQPFNLGVANTLGVGGAVQAQQLDITPQNAASFTPDQNATLDPMQQQQMQAFGRLLTPTEEMELGYRQPKFQEVAGALSNPIGYGAGLISDAVNKIPTGGGTNLGQRVENIDNPFLRTAVQAVVQAAPYVVAGIATGGLADASIGQAFQGQMGMGIAESIGQNENNDWQAIGTNLAMLFAPKLAEMGIKSTGDAVAFLKSKEGAAFIADAKAKMATEGGGGAPLNPGGEPVKPGAQPPAGAGDAASEASLPPTADNLPSPPEASHAENTTWALEHAQENIDNAPHAADTATPSKAAVGLENITRDSGQITQDALARGASPQMARGVGRVMTGIDSVASGADPLLEAGALQQRGAKVLSRITGSIPGQVGKIVNQIDNLRYGLQTDTNKLLTSTVKNAVNSLNSNLDTLVFTGQDATKMDAATAGKAGYAFEFPEDFTGWNPQTLEAVQAAKDAMQSHFAILQAIDPTTAQSAQSYLKHFYEGEKASPLTTPIARQRGEISSAQSRAYPDWRVAVDNGLAMEKMPLGQQIERGMRQVDTGIQDALLRKSVLNKFGTNDPTFAKAPGYTAVTNPIFTRPEEGPWYVPKPVANFIDQRYAPAPEIVSSLGKISARAKGVLTFPFDLGGVTTRFRELATSTPGFAVGLPKQLFAKADTAQFAIDGLPQDNAGSLMAESNTPIIGKSGIGQTISDVNRLPWKGLTFFRNVAHDGNLAMMKALGMDVSPDTAAGIANRQASADIVRAFSGASKGAQRLGRDAIEKTGLLSQANTRAYFAQIGSLSHLLNPSASAAQRLLAAQGITSLATGVWGIGSLINMKYGDGKPLKFPVTWDKDTNSFVYNSNWDMVNNGGYVTPMLPQASLSNTIARAFTAAANEGINHPGGWGGVAPAAGDVAKPLAQFGAGRASPVTGAPLAAAGIGYDDQGKFHAGDMTANQRLGAALPEPISARKGLISSDTLDHPGAAAAEQLAGTLPPLANQASVDVKAALNKAGLGATETTPWASAQGKQIAKIIGMPYSGATLAEYRKQYVDYWTQHPRDGEPAIVAKQNAEHAFDSVQAVKTYNAQVDKSQLDFWKTHIDLLKADIQAGTAHSAELRKLAGYK